MVHPAASSRGGRAPWGAALALLSGALCAGCGDPPAAPAPPAVAYDGAGRWLGAQPPAPPRHGRSLVLVVIDTLRADALERMPFLRGLAARGVRFDQACAPAPWTPPSLASLLTGLLPYEHGCDELDRPLLADALPTYAEALSASHGYQCTAFVDGPWFGESASLLQGFEVGGMNLGLTQIQRGLARWLNRRDPDRPFFLLIHTFDAHDPYGPLPQRPPEGLPPLPEALDDAQVTRWFMTDALRREQLLGRLGPDLARTVLRYTWEGYRRAPDPALAAALREAYYAGVEWVDGLLRETVAWLEGQGLLRDAWLVVTSDHGEAFGEHGLLGHGRDLHDEMLRIPLVVVGPEPFGGGRVAGGSVGLVDVLPTFFASEGLADLPGAHGRSLAGALAPAGATGWPVIAQERVDGRTAPVEHPILLSAVRTATRKWMVRHGPAEPGGLEQVYDLAADPAEAAPGPAPDPAAAPESPDAALAAAIRRARAAQAAFWSSLTRPR